MNIRIEPTALLIAFACIQTSAGAASVETRSPKHDAPGTPAVIEKSHLVQPPSQAGVSNSPSTGGKATNQAATNSAAVRFTALKPIGDWSVDPADTSRLQDIFERPNR